MKLRILTNYNRRRKSRMITIKDIKKVMKEFGKTEEDARKFLIKIERAKKELQELRVERN